MGTRSAHSLSVLGWFLSWTLAASTVFAAEPATHPANVDQYGDPLPPSARLRIGTTRLRHGGSIRAIAFSPDGRMVATAGRDNFLHLWDFATGKGLAHFHVPDCVAVTFADGGKSLRWWDGRGTLYRCDASLRGEDLFGRRLRHLSLGTLERLDAVAFSPDGSGIAVGTSEGVVSWWGQGGEGQRHRTGGIQALALAGGGSLLAVNRGREGISLLDPRTGREVLSFGAEAVRSVAFSPDDRILAAGDFDNRIGLWNASTGQLVRVLEGHRRVPISGKNGVFCLAFTPDGAMLASGAADGTVRLWDVKTGQEKACFVGHGMSVHALAFAPDGKRLISGGDDGVLRVWDPPTGREVGPIDDFGGGVMGMSVSSDGQTLALVRAPGQLSLWDLATGKEPRKMPNPPATVSAAAFRPHRPTLLTASGEGHLHFWNANTGEEVQPTQNVQTKIRLLAVAGDGQTVAWHGEDRRIVLWDAKAGKVLREVRPQGNFVSGLFFSADGQTLFSAGSVGVHLWNVGGKEPDRELSDRSGGVWAAAGSPDGRMLATGGQDGTVRLWELASGKQRRVMYGDTALVRAVAFAADGLLLATGGSNGTVRLWDVTTGQRLHTFAGHRGEVVAVAFAGRRKLVTAGRDGTALVWDLPALLEAGRARVIDLPQQQLQTLWRELASKDAVEAYEAMQTLARAPAQTVPFLRQRVRPVSAEKMARLIEELDSDTFDLRVEAMKELAQMGKFAEASLRKLLAGKPSLEARRRAEELLELLADPIAMTEHLRVMRAVEVLEMIGTDAAQQVLRSLAAGAADAPLTRQAKDALARLVRKSEQRP